MVDTYMSHEQDVALQSAYRPDDKPPTRFPASPAFAVAAEEVAGAARLGDADPLLDPLGYVAAGQVRREFAGCGDGIVNGFWFFLFIYYQNYIRLIVSQLVLKTM